MGWVEGGFQGGAEGSEGCETDELRVGGFTAGCMGG